MAVAAITKNSVSFYPNPVESIMTLTSKGKINSVIISNMVGQEIKRFKPDGTSSVLNLSGLTRGVYFMQVNVNGMIKDYKFIKK